MTKTRLSIFLFGLLLAVPALWGQEAPIEVTTSVDRVRMTIGDIVTYSVKVSHDPGVEVEMPGLGANLGGFQIRDYTLHDPEKVKGRVIREADYQISTFFTGDFDIPPVQVFYRLAGDSAYQSLLTETLRITVESVQEGEGQAELIDIKPPLGLPYDVRRLILFIGLGVLLLSALIVALWIHRRRKSGQGILPKAPPRPPHEIALEALERLAASDLLASGEIKAYYTEVSEIVRQYIEGRFYVQALEMTTWEVLRDLEPADIAPENRELLKRFLERCDMVKFAKWIPTDDAHGQTLAEARTFVEQTKVLLSLETEPETTSEPKTATQDAETGGEAAP